MNFPQLFNPTRLANYVNQRLDHPVLQVPSGAPTYALSTSDEGVLLTRDGDKIGITELPGISTTLEVLRGSMASIASCAPWPHRTPLKTRTNVGMREHITALDSASADYAKAAAQAQIYI